VDNASPGDGGETVASSSEKQSLTSRLVASEDQERKVNKVGLAVVFGIAIIGIIIAIVMSRR